MSRRCRAILLSLLCGFLVSAAFAQGPPKAYGTAITADNAKKVAAAALAEARKNGWYMAIAVVDTSGTLVYYEKMDNTQTGSANVALIGLLAKLRPDRELYISKTIAQGVEMGRPSLLKAEAEKTGGVVTATYIGGRCVPVMSGTIDLF